MSPSGTEFDAGHVGDILRIVARATLNAGHSVRESLYGVSEL